MFVFQLIQVKPSLFLYYYKHNPFPNVQTLLYNGEYYDVVSVARSMSKGQYKVKVSCEHVSYRLNDYSKDAFVATGTIKEVLTKILEDTEFQVGIVDSSEIVTFETTSKATVPAQIRSLSNSKRRRKIRTRAKKKAKAKTIKRNKKRTRKQIKN